MARAPDSLILVYDGDSDLQTIMLDVLKKAFGREDCPLCEITNSPVGKRRAWRECERRLVLPIAELHRDQLRPEWRIAKLPCVLALVGESAPVVLVGRNEIVGCRGNAAVLEERIRAALSARAGARSGAEEQGGAACS